MKNFFTFATNFKEYEIVYFYIILNKTVKPKIDNC